MIKAAIFIVLVAALVSSCKKEHASATFQLPVPVTGLHYTADEVSAFKQLTVRGLYNTGTIKKFKDPIIYIYLADTGYAHMNQELDTIVQEINALAAGNLVLQRSYDKSGSIIKLYLRSQESYLQDEPGAAGSFQSSPYELDGLANVTWSTDGFITHAGVFVDMNRPDTDIRYDEYLLRHELTHAIGFLGHIDMTAYWGSVMFYYRLTPPVNVYAGIDKKLIQLLCSPIIKAGMDETAFNRVVVNL